MVLENMGLVGRFAREFARRYGKTDDNDLEDLIQEGTLGLHRAAELYDKSHGTRFSTYAVPWIKQALWKVLVPHHKALQELRLFEKATRFDAWRDEYGDKVDPPARRAPHTTADWRLGAMQRAFEQLRPIDRKILELRFGLGSEPHALKSIGDRVGRSRERIRQLQVRALRRLRALTEQELALEGLSS